MSLAWKIGTGTLTLIQGDITTADVDAVVNAANPQLAGGGGVDGAIQNAAGPELLKAGRSLVEQYGNLAPGSAVVTPGFDLAAGRVIHAVGPIWNGGEFNEERILESAYRACLEIAESEGLKTIAFPAISCGAYGFPVEKAAPIALRVFQEHLADNAVQDIRMYLHSSEDFSLWKEQAQRLLGQPQS
ncbi:MAG: macro domain-containing protein [Desulfovibrionales bacterium]